METKGKILANGKYSHICSLCQQTRETNRPNLVHTCTNLSNFSPAAERLGLTLEDTKGWHQQLAQWMSADYPERTPGEQEKCKAVCGQCGATNDKCVIGSPIPLSVLCRCKTMDCPAGLWQSPELLTEAKAGAESLGYTWADAKHWMAAIVKWTKAGRPIRSDEEVEKIYREICKPCDQFADDRCKVCRCGVKASGMSVLNKIKLATEHCEGGGKWPGDVT